MTAPSPREILGDLSAGRVLDVATGTGGFVRYLLDGLADHGEIVGIDANADRAGPFGEAFAGHPEVGFAVMDAHALAFADDSFDTVCVSNSLHHFEDPAPVLAEMLRVVRPGGLVIVNEMFRDGQSPAQLTHVHLHHWWAAVNRIRGEVHRETYRRREIVAIVESLGLGDLRLVDVDDAAQDPHDPAAVADLEAAIDRYVDLAAGHRDLQDRGAALRRRLLEVGVRSATQLVAIGRAATLGDDLTTHPAG